MNASTWMSERAGHGAVLVSGDDATSFLQSLVSQDLDPVGDGEGVVSLLLSPQGKLGVLLRMLRVGDGVVARLRGGLRRAPGRVDRSVPHPRRRRRAGPQ